MAERAERTTEVAGEIEVLPAPPMVESQPAELGGHQLPKGTASHKFTAEQIRLLRQPIPSDDLDVLPTGEVYASQVRYRRILADAFGPGGWALVPVSPYFRAGNTLVREYALYVKSGFISQAFGEADYYANSRQSWATVAESVRSNALVRTCKDLLIASECWDGHFTQAFLEQHCVRVFVDVKDQGALKTKPQWRRKDGKPFVGERGLATDVLDGKTVVREPQALPEPPAASGDEPRLISDKQRSRLFAITAKGVGIEALKKHLAEEFGLDSTADITREQYEAICTFAAGTEPGANG